MFVPMRMTQGWLTAVGKTSQLARELNSEIELHKNVSFKFYISSVKGKNKSDDLMILDFPSNF